jgi:hypothetical protein
MATSGSTIDNPIVYFPVGSTLGQDVNSWIRKDTTGPVYYGYALNLSADPATAVWRIRKETTTGSVTVVTYANGGTFDQIWNNRASLNYQ